MHPPKIPNYSLEEFIGDGPSGSVWIARFRGQAPVALKVFRPLAINRQLLSDALVRVYDAQDHPGVVKVHDFDLASPQAYATTDLCAEEVQLADGRSVWKPRTLETLCGALGEADAWRIATQIADALAFLHRKRVIHANLKPSNVLFGDGDSPRAMVADFCQGLVGGIEQIDVGTSAFYAAPEQLVDPDHFFEGRAERWDVYRFGVTVYQLLTGQLPRLDEEAKLFAKQRSRELDVGNPIDLAEVAAALGDLPEIRWPQPAESNLETARRRIVETCLRLDPSERYVDMREVLEALRDAEHEQEHIVELEDFEEEKGELKKAARGARRRAALFGTAAAAAAGIAAFALVDRFGKADDPSGDPPDNGLAAGAGAPAGDPQPPEEPASEPENTALLEANELLAGALGDLERSQSALDGLFEIIAARDAQGQPLYDLPEGALGMALNYYEEFSERHLANPEKADQVAGALNNAGELKMILGDATGAVSNLSAAAAMLDGLETGGGDPGDLLGRRARAYSNLADAQAAAGLPGAAVQSAKRSDEIYKQLADAAGGGDLEMGAKRRFAASSLELGRRLIDAKQPGEAGLYIDRAATLLQPLEAEGLANEGDLATLAAAAFERGRLERALAERESAIKSQIEAIDRYLALIEARPEIDDYRFQLARAYGEAAELASLLGEPGEAASANAEASSILRVLAEAAPEHAAYRYQLARRLRSVASGLRDSGDAEKARAEQEKAIVLLEDLSTSFPNEPLYRYDLAIVTGVQSDLLGEAKMLDEALAKGKQAVDLMQDLLTTDLDSENNGAKRARYRRALAALYGKLGHHTERSGDKEAAAHCFDKALRHYTSLADADASDTAATEGVKWAEDRIARLQ